ncbi:MAG: hypothetical protein ABI977_00060 [Acidobacteriota bacterium]
MTEQIAPLGSHQFLDQLNLAYHRKVVVRLLASPKAVLQTAFENLRRWQKIHEGTTTAQAITEWKTLLETKSLSELAAILTEDSDEGQRLRQSSPFAGVLMEQERDAMFDDYEKRASSQSHPAGA